MCQKLAGNKGFAHERPNLFYGLHPSCSYLGYGLMAGRAAVLSEEGLEAGHPCVPTGHSGNYTYGGKLMQMKAHKVSGCQDGWVVRGWAWQWRNLQANGCIGGRLRNCMRRHCSWQLG